MGSSPFGAHFAPGAIPAQQHCTRRDHSTQPLPPRHVFIGSKTFNTPRMSSIEHGLLKTLPISRLVKISSQRRVKSLKKRKPMEGRITEFIAQASTPSPLRLGQTPVRHWQRPFLSHHHHGGASSRGKLVFDPAPSLCRSVG